jgi:TonB family protein
MVLYERTPTYTDEAQRARIQGVAQVEAIITESGLVGEARIYKSLDQQFGLDAKAIEAAKAWRFRPAMKDGKPVPFKAIIELEFRLPPAQTTPDVPTGAQTQDPVKPGPGITNPKVIYEEKPKYTQEALKAKIQGVVQVEAVVREDGTVGEVRIHKSLDRVFGLDAEALRAARAWRFTPAMKDGKPVPFVVIMELEFRLGQKRTPADEEFERGAEREGTPGLVMPVVKWEAKPKYTSEAMRNKVQGLVGVQVVVGPDGKVVRGRVTQSLDKNYGLDDEALKAAMLWRFDPGMLNGKAVSVLMNVTLEFRLH